MDIGLDEDDEVTDIREQIFHNTVREQIVSDFNHTFNRFNFPRKRNGYSPKTRNKKQILRRCEWHKEIQLFNGILCRKKQRYTYSYQ